MAGSNVAVAWRRITTADTTVGGVGIPKYSRRLIITTSAKLSLYLKDEGRRMAFLALLADMDDGTRVSACGPTRLIAELKTLSAN